MALNTIKASNIEDGTIAGIDFDDNSISSDNIAALSSSKLSGALPALNGSALTNLTAANLTGALPVLDGTALTGIVSDFAPLENQMSRLGLHLGAVDQCTPFPVQQRSSRPRFHFQYLRFRSNHLNPIVGEFQLATTWACVQ